MSSLLFTRLDLMRFVQSFKEAFSVLPRIHRVRLAQAGAISFLAAILELASVTAIFPFLTLAVEPNAVTWNQGLLRLQQWTGLDAKGEFQIFLGVIVLVLVIMSNVVGAFAKWFHGRVMWNMQTNLSMRLLGSYLAHPYSYFLTRNTAAMRANVLQQTLSICSGLFGSAVTLLQSVLIALGIFASLLWIRPVASAVIIGVFGGAYALIFILLRTATRRKGEELLEENSKRFHVVQEAFGSLKETKFYGIEPVLVDSARPHTYRYTRASAIVSLLSAIPFHALQIIAFGGLMAVFLVLLSGLESLDRVIPTMGFFAFAGYRVMPAFQQAMTSLNNIRVYWPVMSQVRLDLDAAQEHHDTGPAENVEMRTGLDMEEISFCYSGAKEKALHEVSLSIPCGSTIGIVGPSGSGKTTLLDIILGLLRPTQGKLVVDGIAIETDAQLRGWQSHIGYVPQEVTLHDASITENIAFGVPPNRIDMERVRAAAEQAHMSNFIEKSLPQKYDTKVGERGVRLSGGQRQRLGIARALYRDPDVLVFDEATSNLDNQMEARIAQAIRELGRTKTIIVVAHRLNTVQNADRLYVLDEGILVSEGTYEELLDSDPHFRALARVGLSEE